MLHLRPGMIFSWSAPAKWLLALLLGVCAFLPAFGGRSSGHAQRANSSEQQVTFNRDIAPIIFHSCSSCHRPGEAAPFSLLTYEDVKKHARQIAEVTRARNMPPWLPEPQGWSFAEEWRLPVAQIDLIKGWGKQGAMEGNPADRPPQPK